MAKLNKDEIKNNLTIEQVFELVSELGGEPIMKDSSDAFISRTICHNLPGEGSRKLYYYDNSKMFQCYTDCGESFDIFELVVKVKNTRKEPIVSYSMITKKTQESKWEFTDALRFVANFFNIREEVNFGETFSSPNSLLDWELFQAYAQREAKRQNASTDKKIELKIYDDSILKFLPQLRVLPWEDEGISFSVMKNKGIAYNPRTQGIVIPHYNINGELVGIRERTLIEEEEVYGKYKPAILNGVMYNHPLGFNLYNLNNSKEAIKILKKAIVFEGEKSPLLYASYFGIDNDITVATCGSNLLSNQMQLLLSLGVQEIIIAFDKQFQKIGDDEWKRLVKNLTNLHTKYGKYVQISYMFDKNNLIGYKDSPIDCGKEIFLQMFKERVVIE